MRKLKEVTSLGQGPQLIKELKPGQSSHKACSRMQHAVFLQATGQYGNGAGVHISGLEPPAALRFCKGTASPAGSRPALQRGPCGGCGQSALPGKSWEVTDRDPVSPLQGEKMRAAVR